MLNFWKRAAALNIALSVTPMEKYNMQTPKLLTTGERTGELGRVLVARRAREMGYGYVLTDEEYDQIEIIGSTVR